MLSNEILSNEILSNEILSNEILSGRPQKTTNKKSRPLSSRKKKPPGKETLITILKTANTTNVSPKINGVVDSGLYLVNQYNTNIYINIIDRELNKIIKITITKFYNNYLELLIKKKLYFPILPKYETFIPTPSPSPEFPQYKKNLLLQKIAANNYNVPSNVTDTRNLHMKLLKELNTNI